MKIPMNDQHNIQHPLQKLVEKVIKIITNDGRIYVGVLRGVDQAMNCIICDTQEHIYTVTAPINKQPLGIYMVRGDSIVAIGEYT